MRCPGIRRASGLATHRDASKPSECEAALLLGLDSLRSCNAHPLATFAARKLLTTFVGEPDRYAAGAFFALRQQTVFSHNRPLRGFATHREANTPSEARAEPCLDKATGCVRIPLLRLQSFASLTRRTPLHLLLRQTKFFYFF